MQICWLGEPVARPTFEELRAKLARMLENSVDSYGYVSDYHARYHGAIVDDGSYVRPKSCEVKERTNETSLTLRSESQVNEDDTDV